MANNKNNRIVNSETEVEKNDLIDEITTVENKSSTVVIPDIKIKETTNVSEVLNTIKNGMKDQKLDPETKVERQENITINPDEEIDVRSCVGGGFNWVSKGSGIYYRWLHFNDVQPMKFSDLEYMRRNSPHHIDKPNVIVDDVRVVQKFRLIPLYTKVAEAMSVESAVNSEAKMIALCKNAKLTNMRDLVIDKLSALINENKLVNYKVIKAAGNILNYKFDMK